MKEHIKWFYLFLVFTLLLTSCLKNGSGIEECYLRIDILGKGQVLPANRSFAVNTTITFEILPASGWAFSNWEGNNRYEVQNNQGKWQLLMNNSKNLVAVFSPIEDQEPEPGDPDYPEMCTLLVQVEGKGQVFPNSGEFAKYTILDLIVAPMEGWCFDRWEGSSKEDIFPNEGSWLLFMDGNKSLVAIFKENKPTYFLDIEIVGEGKVIEKLINSEYPASSLVSLWAKPANGWLFKEWQGDIKGTDEMITIEIDRNMRVKAVFVQEEVKYELIIKKIGKGQVKEELISSEYGKNEIVRLTAIPNPGWQFNEWRGLLQ